MAFAPSCGSGPTHEPCIMSAEARLLLVEDERNVAETLASGCAPPATR